ncbi:MAG: hypothetical protein JWO68_1391, partial [Actinomycetia bacterium]|nr:hypothetical protein [Actinomycetes bacterium]
VGAQEVPSPFSLWKWATHGPISYRERLVGGTESGAPGMTPVVAPLPLQGSSFPNDSLRLGLRSTGSG